MYSDIWSKEWKKSLAIPDESVSDAVNVIEDSTEP